MRSETSSLGYHFICSWAANADSGGLGIMPAHATHHITDVGGRGATRRTHTDINAKGKYPRPVSEEAAHSSETNKVVLVNKRHIVCAVFANELLDLVRVIVVAVSREVVIIASEVFHVLR